MKKFCELKSVEYRDAIKSKETRQGCPSACDVVAQWMSGTVFTQTLPARAHSPLHLLFMASLYSTLFNSQNFFIYFRFLHYH